MYLVCSAIFSHAFMCVYSVGCASHTKAYPTTLKLHIGVYFVWRTIRERFFSQNDGLRASFGWAASCDLECSIRIWTISTKAMSLPTCHYSSGFFFLIIAQANLTGLCQTLWHASLQAVFYPPGGTLFLCADNRQFCSLDVTEERYM